MIRWILGIVLLLVNNNASKAHLLPQLFSFRSAYMEQCKEISSNCTVIEYKTNVISHKSLIDLLESPSFEKTHKKLRIKYDGYYVIINMTVISHDLLNTYTDIDKFLLPRPWWIIRQYPREHVHGVLGVDVLPQMILERVPLSVEQVARAIVAQHFPSPEDCGKRPMYLKTAVGSWGNDIIVNQRIFFENFPSAIHHLYVTDTGSPLDKIAYIERSHCPNLVDKHQCAFLAVSNCTLPSVLTNCRNRDCIKEGLYRSPTSSAHNSSSYILSQEKSEDLRNIRFEEVYPSVFPSIHLPDSPAYRMKDPTKLPTKENTELFTDFEQIRNYYTIFWMFNVLYRPNFLLGLQIQDLLQELYTPAVRNTRQINNNENKKNNRHDPDSYLYAHELSNFANASSSFSHKITSFAHVQFERNISVATRCIAAHIRMGDRHLNNTDMKKWCLEHTHPNKTGDERAKGTWIDGSPLDMGEWHDMGCHMRQPFGSVRLLQVIQAAQYLNPEIQDIFVMTDDYNWLHRAMVEYRKSPEYRPDIRLQIFPTHVHNVHDSRMTLKATSEWWASVAAARQCEGFVGHRGSAATHALYWALCFNHGRRRKYFKCPPWYYFD